MPGMSLIFVIMSVSRVDFTKMIFGKNRALEKIVHSPQPPTAHASTSTIGSVAVALWCKPTGVYSTSLFAI